METLTFLDYISFATMLLFWLFYDVYTRNYISKKGGKSVMSIANGLRFHWVHSFVMRKGKDRITDAQLINILHRGISFFISITIFIIAGLMTMLASSDAILSVLNEAPLLSDNFKEVWNIKIIFMIIVFVVAFFRLTWSLRQNQYFAIAVFGIPDNSNIEGQDICKLVRKISKLGSDSGKNFNNALRSYYFGLSMMLWLIHPGFFILGTIVVVWVIYRREFHSKTLSMLDEINQTYSEYSGNKYLSSDEADKS